MTFKNMWLLICSINVKIKSHSFKKKKKEIILFNNMNLKDINHNLSLRYNKELLVSLIFFN